MSHIVHRRLAIAAATFAILAPFAGTPYRSRQASVDVSALARAVEREEDHVTAIELARWIRERRSGLRVIDVRSRAEYDTFHVPSAEYFALDSLVRVSFGPQETVVIYSEGGAHAAQAWVLLRARGVTQVYFLKGGLFEWIEDVLEPKIAEHATPEETARFAEVSALSRYFDGVPRVVSASEASAIPMPTASRDQATFRATSGAVARVKRRGC